MKGILEGMLMLVGMGGLVAFLLMQVLGFGLPVDLDVSQSFDQAQGGAGGALLAAPDKALAAPREVQAAEAAPAPDATQADQLAAQANDLAQRQAQLDGQAASLAEREAALAQVQTDLQTTAQGLEQRQAQIAASEAALAEEARRLQALAAELEARGQVQEQEARRQEVIAEMLARWAAHLQAQQEQVQAEQEKVKEMKLLLGGLAALSGVLTLASAAWLLIAHKKRSK